ncbi:MAG: cation-translocating P-type ATPase [Chitinophagales bacterium]|jgi:Ca2+-transporting ATPase|nr:cation-translocating P-type ATPase [Bacteroidota bacterium]MBP8915266.1 cation-translocating P-type ATPase [Chitinophagales bacterium]MBP9219909.1 cation-translocating P-type ATPase [Chitinophagales bacterium]MBP9795079.1 cation-translocating P-type ATPase [Chitinophagales bacterium]
MNHHLLPISEIEQLFNTSEAGLNTVAAEKLLLEFGKNELAAKKKKSTIVIFLSQFKDVMIFILLAAAAVSIFIGEMNDAYVILIIVLLNAVIGFMQEYKAEKAMVALKKMSASSTIVRREGKIFEIPSIDLVPGDVVLMESGNLVPADMRLRECHSLKIEEAALTGESIAIDKITEELTEEKLSLGDIINMAFKGTIVTYGRGEGIVVATGMQTEIGRIAKLLDTKELQTPLQKKLADFGKKLSFIVIAICVVMFGVGLLRGEEPIQMLLTSISVAVAAIPEALPALIIIALAIGAKRLVRINALIRKLPATETLGSVTYICTDKTGTITQNKMTVTNIWQMSETSSFKNLSADELLLIAMELNHDVMLDENNNLKGDPTEIALVEYSRSNRNNKIAFNIDQPREQELPFDSERKRMSVIYPFNNAWMVITKGAVESILEICDEKNAAQINTATAEFAKEGKRILAYSFRELPDLPDSFSVETIECKMHFLGLVAMIDPPRLESKQAIIDCKTAGIIPVMITGDHPITARVIAMETGIIGDAKDKIITGAELDALSDAEFEKEVENIRLYARVSPEQKLLIVKTLQKRSQIVAMTGDGVNDAPALRRADIGVAMGITGTDVSKEAADMILLDDNFATLIKAIKEGRRIYDNIRKFFKYILTSNGGEIWTLFLAPLIGLPLPLLPIHILYINLVTDGLPGLAFAAEPSEKDILNRKPRKPNESIFANGIGIHILWVGFFMGAICLATQAIAMHLENDKWQTMVFTVLCISQMGHAMAIRSNMESLFQQGVFGNKQLAAAVLLTLGLQMIVIYVPFMQDIFGTEALSLNELLICIAISSTVFWVVEFEKLLKRTKAKKINLPRK